MGYPTDLSYGPETRIVLIGTSECPRDATNLPPLPQVHANIERLQQLFLDPDVVGLPESTVAVVMDEAEASAVTSHIETAASEATDTLIIYYAGHGIYGDQYAPLYLTSKYTKSQSKHSAINVSDVKRIMAESRAKKRILILDCCYSGRAFSGGMGTVGIDDLNDAVDLTGTYGIAAAPGDQKALAPLGARFTRFTDALVTVLEKGIKTENPTLTLDEVFRAVKSQIAHHADAPLPQRLHFEDASTFRLARNRYQIGSSTKTANRLRALETRIESAEKVLGSQSNRVDEKLFKLERRLIGVFISILVILAFSTVLAMYVNAAFERFKAIEAKVSMIKEEEDVTLAAVRSRLGDVETRITGLEHAKPSTQLSADVSTKPIPPAVKQKTSDGELKTIFDGIVAKAAPLEKTGDLIKLEFNLWNVTDKDIRVGFGPLHAPYLIDSATGEKWTPFDSSGNFQGDIAIGAGKPAVLWFKFKEITNPEKRKFYLSFDLFKEPLENLYLR